MVVVSHHGGLKRGGLSWWSLIRVVLKAWSVIRVVLKKVVCLGGLKRVVSHYAGLSSWS